MTHQHLTQDAADEARRSLEQKLATNASPDKILLTRGEAAVYLGISYKSLESYSSKKYPELKFSLIGNRARYLLSDILDYLELKKTTNC